MCLNYRELQAKNFSRAFIEITTALETCVEAMTLKTEYAKVNEKITQLKHEYNLNKQNQYRVNGMSKINWKIFIGK